MPLRSSPIPLHRICGRLVVFGAAVLLGGCRAAAGPVEAVPANFDAPTFAAGIDALEEAIAGDGWLSFARLGPQFALPPMDFATTSRRNPGSAALPVIPQSHRGVTLVHDGENYVVDGQRTGAPTDGVRFVLYAIDEGSGQPLLDAENGHADLRDLGSELAAGFAVAVEVVGPAGTVAVYTGSFGLEETASRAGGVSLFDHDGIDLAGRITNEGEELEFEFVTGTSDGLENTDADLRLNGGELIVTGVLGADISTGEVDVDFSLVAGGDSLRLSGHSGGEGFAGTVRLNGDPIATLIDDDDTEVEPASPIRLSAEQASLLRSLPDLVDLLFGLVHATSGAIELD